MMVELLRTAADLVEDGTIHTWAIEQEWGIDVRPDPATNWYSLRHVPNGKHKVVITLEAGHLTRQSPASKVRRPRRKRPARSTSEMRTATPAGT